VNSSSSSGYPFLEPDPEQMTCFLYQIGALAPEQSLPWSQVVLLASELGYYDDLADVRGARATCIPCSLHRQGTDWHAIAS